MEYKEKIRNLYNKVRFSALLEDSYIAKKLEEAFPELKEETEDERIRKEMIFYFTEEIPQCSIQEHVDKMKEFIAWLKKKGKLKEHNICDTCDEQYSCISPCPVKLLDKQGEQHPKFRIGDIIKKKSTGDIGIISEIDLKNRKYRLKNTGFIPFKYEHLWELVEQNSAWSEEDEKMMRYVIGSIDTNISDSNFKNIRIWFESLKGRIKPQNHWKPSDEQIKALDITLSIGIQIGTWEEDVLKSLKEDLKKLRG